MWLLFGHTWKISEIVYGYSDSLKYNLNVIIYNNMFDDYFMTNQGNIDYSRFSNV